MTFREITIHCESEFLGERRRKPGFVKASTPANPCVPCSWQPHARRPAKQWGRRIFCPYFAPMLQEIKSSTGRVFITIEPDPVNRWITVDWRGYLTAASIKAGAHAYTEALAKSGFSCVLNDTRHVLGPWDHSMDWVINEWAPNAARAGLRHFAMITTPASLADESAATFYAQLKAFRARVFDDPDAARHWLRQQQASANGAAR